MHKYKVKLIYLQNGYTEDVTIKVTAKNEEQAIIKAILLFQSVVKQESFISDFEIEWLPE